MPATSPDALAALRADIAAEWQWYEAYTAEHGDPEMIFKSIAMAVERADEPAVAGVCEPGQDYGAGLPLSDDPAIGSG